MSAFLNRHPNNSKLSYYDFSNCVMDTAYSMKVPTKGKYNSFRKSAIKYASRHDLKLYIRTQKSVDGQFILYMFKVLDEETFTS
jgi:hypothetical protein